VKEGSKVPLPQLEPSVHGPCSHIEGEGRGKMRKTYFLKNITFFFVSLKNSCNFATFRASNGEIHESG